MNGLSGQINIFAILAAALAVLVIAAIWYSPLLFGRFLPAPSTASDQRSFLFYLRLYLVTLMAGLLSSLLLSLSLLGTNGIIDGIMAGFLAALGWVATFTAIHFLFEKRPFKFYLIHIGFSFLSMMTMGAILGWWK